MADKGNGNGKPIWGNVRGPSQTFTIPGGPTFEVRQAKPDDPARPGEIRIGPGESVQIEYGATFGDQHGPPIEVSSKLRPDPLSIYWLGMTLRDCTEEVARIDARNSERLAEFTATTAKHARRSTVLFVGVGCVSFGLFVVSMLNFVHAVWNWP